jgi:hypothetical protein
MRRTVLAIRKIIGVAIIASGLFAMVNAGFAWIGGISAHAQSNPFVGRWHWNSAQSVQPPGEPAPKDVVTEITRMDEAGVSWSLTVLSDGDQREVETFSAAPDGAFHPINTDTDTTVAFHLMGSGLQVTFKGASGQTDTLTCALSPAHDRMTCNGVLSSGDGHATSYVDVYDRM